LVAALVHGVEQPAHHEALVVAFADQ